MAETNPGASKMEHRLVVLHFFSQRTSSRRKRLIQEWVVRPSIAVPGIPESMPSLTARTQVKDVSQLGHLFPNDRIVVSLIRVQILRVLFVRFRSWCNCLRQRGLEHFHIMEIRPIYNDAVHPATDSVSRHACRDPSD